MSGLRPSPVGDLSPTDWMLERMGAFDGSAQALVPGPFEAYARLFHRPDQGKPDEDCATSWAVVADRRGTTLHEAAQWDYLAGWTEDSSAVGGDRSRDDQPLHGTLDQLTLPLLRDVLSRHTRTQGRCWLAHWVGYGAGPAGWSAAPTFGLGPPRREYWLFESSLEQVVEYSVAFRIKEFADEDSWSSRLLEWGDVQSPQLWWPEDRAWAVASEIDFDSTVVAGTAALIEDLLQTPDIECLRISPDTSLYYPADEINARRS